MHISSLFGDYSCGTFGDECKYFIDFMSDCGFKFWQVLPFTTVDEFGSPYKSFSAFAGNPYFIDPKTPRTPANLTAFSPSALLYLKVRQNAFRIKKRWKNSQLRTVI